MSAPSSTPIEPAPPTAEPTVAGKHAGAGAEPAGKRPSIGRRVADQVRQRLEARGVREVVRSRVFWTAIGVKLVIGTLFASSYMRELFAPFIGYFIDSGFSDPWQHFAAIDPRKFPYPPLMLYLMMLPRLVLAPWFGQGQPVTPLDLLALRLPLLAADVALLLVLTKWFPSRARLLLVLGFCSPLLVYVNYFHGQLDIVPTALLLTSLYLLHRGKHVLAAVGMGAMLATKGHLLIALPFVAVYLARTVGVRSTLLLGLICTVSFAAWMLPYALTDGFRVMVLGSSEKMRALAFRLPVAGAQTLMVAPLALSLLWFRFATYAKLNWDLLMMYLGIAFCMFITLAPPQPAYVLWFLPFWLYYSAKSERAQQLSWATFNLAYFAYWALHPESDYFDAWRTIAPALASLGTPRAQLSGWVSEAGLLVAQDVVFTATVASLMWCVYEMYRGGVTSNEVYRARQKPVLVGLAGDSGSGKDVMAQDLSSVLGKDELLVLAGDDYHHWPRGHEMWNVYTHLDARANDIHQQMEHVIGFSQGNAVTKGTYDHQTGQFNPVEKVDPRKYVLVAGLHALANEAQRRMFDLSIFLDPDESLRRYWKVRRDCRERGYAADQVLAAIDRRSSDRNKYVLVQREVADVIIHLRALGEPPEPSAEDDAEPALALEVRALNSFDLGKLATMLREVDTLIVEHDPFADARWQNLKVMGHVSALRIREICEAAIPNFDEVARSPVLAPDLRGVQQAIVLCCLSARLRWSRRASDAITPRGLSQHP